MALEMPGGDAVMMLHRPGVDRLRGTAVLLCPPFGWHEVCAYRGLRTWAQELAAAGYPAARLSLPSSGDAAGSPLEPGRLQAWIDATCLAAEHLRAVTGSRRTVAIGLELGGMIVCRAQAAGAAIDDLVIWGAPARGRALIREMKMFAQIVDGLYPGDVREGSSEQVRLAGYPMSGETVEDISAMDLCQSPAPGGPGRRILMLGRDGSAPDARLRRHFEQSGAVVEVADGVGYMRLMSPPQASQPPIATIERTLDWLARGADDPPVAPEPVERATVRCGEDESVIESALWLGRPGEAVFGVLSEPATAPRARTCVVFVGAGGIEHCGPNRLWVDVARRWASRGVPCVRLDLAGIGEADGDEPGLLQTPVLHASWREREIQLALDHLQEQGIADHFILGGACSGAYLALRTARHDERVTGLLMVNLTAFAWSTELLIERAAHNVLTAAVSRVLPRTRRPPSVDPELWALATRAEATDTPTSPARRELAALAARHARPDRAWRLLARSMERRELLEARAALTALEERGVQTTLFLARDEPLLEQLRRQRLLGAVDSWPGFSLVLGDTHDHMHRAAFAQQEVEDTLDRAIERGLIGSPIKL